MNSRYSPMTVSRSWNTSTYAPDRCLVASLGESRRHVRQVRWDPSEARRSWLRDSRSRDAASDVGAKRSQLRLESRVWLVE